MSTAVQLRRGTTAQHAGFTGAVGEVTVDTDKDTVVVHDGATAGGHPLAKDATIGARKASAVAGTVDAITATFSPAFASLAATAGYVLAIPLAGANTSTTPSLAVDGFAAKTIVKGSNVALAVGDIPGADFVGLFVYDASLDKFQLLNPYQATAASATQIFSLTASVAANALTISAGTLSLDFRSATLGTGTATQVVGDPADLVISSGSTLGTTNGVKSRIAVLAINNAGTIELAAVNTAGGIDLTETGLITTTAEGGAGGADSISTIYSTTARTNVAYRLLGYVESTQATAGTWATAPSTVQGAGGVSMSEVVHPAPCRAWVNFNGTGTVAIRAAFNVSSITDNGTGDYTVNFTNALADANYEVSASVQPNIGTNNPPSVCLHANNPASYVSVAPTTSAFRFMLVQGTTAFDSAYCNAAIFR